VVWRHVEAGAISRAPVRTWRLRSIARGHLSALSAELQALPVVGAGLFDTPCAAATADAKTKVYGRSYPLLTYLRSPAVSWWAMDNVIAALPAASGENVGSSPSSSGGWVPSVLYAELRGRNCSSLRCP